MKRNTVGSMEMAPLNRLHSPIKELPNFTMVEMFAEPNGANLYCQKIFGKWSNRFSV